MIIQKPATNGKNTKLAFIGTKSANEKVMRLYMAIIQPFLVRSHSRDRDSYKGLPQTREDGGKPVEESAGQLDTKGYTAIFLELKPESRA